MKTSPLLTALVTSISSFIFIAPVQAQWSSNASKIFYNTGNVGIGTSDPAYPFDVRSTGTRAIYALATASTGTADALYGQSKSAAGRGVVGYASRTTGANTGVYGRSDSTTGKAMSALANATSGTTYAVYAKCNSASGFGIYSAAGKNYYSGKIGLGTTNPWARLDIRSGNESAPALQASGPNTRTLVAFTNGDALVGPVDSAAGAYFSGSTAGGVPTAIIGWANGTAAVSHMFMTQSTVAFNSAVGIGLTNPGFQLQLSSNSAAKPTSNSWTIASDERLKKNIHPISQALDRLLQLRGVTYQWKNPETQGDMSGTYTGMIAQDVEKVFPEWISEGPDGYKRLTVIGFEGLTIEALRDLRQEKDREIKSLREQNAAQQNSIEQLAKRLAQVEALLNDSQSNAANISRAHDQAISQTP